MKGLCGGFLSVGGPGRKVEDRLMTDLSWVKGGIMGSGCAGLKKSASDSTSGHP